MWLVGDVKGGTLDSEAEVGNCRTDVGLRRPLQKYEKQARQVAHASDPLYEWASCGKGFRGTGEHAGAVPELNGELHRSFKMHLVHLTVFGHDLLQG